MCLKVPGLADMKSRTANRNTVDYSIDTVEEYCLVDASPCHELSIFVGSAVVGH